MVEDNVRIDLDSALLQGFDCGQVLLPAAVFGGHTPLLIKFPQIVQIVDPIAHIRLALVALIGRGEPHTGEAQGGQTGRVSLRPPPVPAVGGQIPLKILKQCFLLFHNAHFLHIYLFGRFHCNTVWDILQQHSTQRRFEFRGAALYAQLPAKIWGTPQTNHFLAISGGICYS